MHIFLLFGFFCSQGVEQNSFVRNVSAAGYVCTVVSETIPIIAPDHIRSTPLPTQRPAYNVVEY